MAEPVAWRWRIAAWPDDRWAYQRSEPSGTESGYEIEVEPLYTTPVTGEGGDVSEAEVHVAAVAMADVIARRHGHKDGSGWMSEARFEEARAALTAARRVQPKQDAPSPDVAGLIEALRRIAEATPHSTNSFTAPDAFSWVGAVAKTALSRLTPPKQEPTVGDDGLIERLRRERDEARQIVRDIFWMALRYADGRMTYAVGMVNDAVRKGYDGGWITPKDTGGDPTTPRFARDGMMREWTEPVSRAETAEAALAAAHSQHEADVARIGELEEALKPLAAAADQFDRMPVKDPEQWSLWSTTSSHPDDYPSKSITVGDARRARSALAKVKP